MVNKNGREGFTDREWEQSSKYLHEFLDVEHNIETLKIFLGTWADMSVFVAQHNAKCRDRGYIKKRPLKRPGENLSNYSLPHRGKVDMDREATKRNRLLSQ